LAADKAKETKDSKSKGGDCSINKFDGLCHHKDGSVTHPNGVRKMGVNEWLGTDEQLIKHKSKKHNKKHH